MPALQCAALSVVMLLITAPKLLLSIRRQCHKTPQDHSPVSNTKLWLQRLQTTMSMGLFVVSCLLFVFSLSRPKETELQVLLALSSLASLSYLGTHLSFFCQRSSYHSHWIWRPPFVFLVLCGIATFALTITIAKDVGHTDSLKISLLCLLLAGSLIIDVVYLCSFLMRHPYDHCEDIDACFYWNIGLCCINWLGTLVSLTLYLTETTDYITSLLIDNAVHMVPIFGLLWRQCVALRSAKQPCPGSSNNSRRPYLRAGSDPALSISQLVPCAELGDCAPPA